MLSRENRFWKRIFPLSGIIAENLLFLTMWVSAGYLLWPIWAPSGYPILTIIWAITVIIIQILLKKHNCSGCWYYDKRCHLGWGKISSAMFKKDSGNPETGKKLSIFYILPPPLIFLASLIFGITEGVSLFYWSVLTLFAVLNGITFPVRKKAAVCVQ